jgi:hypothetical protein
LHPELTCVDHAPRGTIVNTTESKGRLLRMPSHGRTRARFDRALFHGRCRRNLLAGLFLLTVALLYSSLAGQHFRHRGADATAFDQPLVRAAQALVVEPADLRGLQPQNDRELYLRTVVSDQHDVLFGLVVLLLRFIVALTIGGLGLVLVTAGATEWEIRSHVEGSRQQRDAG